MAKKEQSNTIATWLWNSPIKFTGLLVGGMILLLLAISLITMPFEKPLPNWAESLILITLMSFIGFAIYKLIKFTPATHLDRKSFIGIDVGITIISILLYFIIPFAIILAFGFTNYNQAAVALGYLMGFWAVTNPLIFIGVMLVLSIIATYLMGLFISFFIIIFRRGQMMGISKLKLWLSFPAGMQLLWLPQYFLPEEKKTKSVVQFKAKWYSNAIEWIIKKPLNAVIVWFAMIFFSFISAALIQGEFFSLFLELIFIIAFIVMLAICGVAKFKKAVPGWFSWVAVIVNILIIIATLSYAIPGIKKANATDQPIVVETTEPNDMVE